MKMSKFIQEKIEITSKKYYRICEYDKFIQTHKIYKSLLEMDRNISIDNLISTMLKEDACVKFLSTTQECIGKNQCHECWEKYLTKELQPFQRTTCFAILRGNNGDKMVETVKSADYMEWLYDALNRSNGHIDGENILYASDEKDKEYGRLLPIFMMYISDLVAETDIENLANADEWESERYLLKIKDKYIDICEVFGQGSVVFVNEIKDEPKTACLEMPSEVQI